MEPVGGCDFGWIVKRFTQSGMWDKLLVMEIGRWFGGMMCKEDGMGMRGRREEERDIDKEQMGIEYEVDVYIMRNRWV